MTERELFQKAVLEHMVNDRRVKANCMREKATLTGARRVLTAAACLLLANTNELYQFLIFLFCISF